MIEAWRNSDWFERTIFLMVAVALTLGVMWFGNALITQQPIFLEVGICDREKPTAAMILDCQATRESATAIAGDK